jgi:hypothetical protein
MPPASVGDLVVVVEAADQSLWTRGHADKMGVLLGRAGSNMWRLLVDGRVMTFHRLDFRVLE